MHPKWKRRKERRGDKQLLAELARKVMEWPADRLKDGVAYRSPDRKYYLFLWDESSAYVRKIEGWNPLENLW